GREELGRRERQKDDPTRGGSRRWALVRSRDGPLPDRFLRARRGARRALRWVRLSDRRRVAPPRGLEQGFSSSRSSARSRSRPLIHAVPPTEVAPLAVRIAEETDRRVASLPAERMYPADPDSPLNAFRSDHRGEHLDEIEAALGQGAASPST